MGNDAKCVRRMRPEDRRSAILDAALAVFAESGFGSATLQEVSRQAGVTKGCLYHHFESKEQLLLTLLRERLTLAESEEETAAQAHPAANVATPAQSREEAIKTLVENLWSHFQRPGQLELMTLAITELPKAPKIAKALFDDVACRGRSSMCDALRAIVRGPEIAAEADDAHVRNATIEAAARIVPSMIMGAALGQRMFGAIDCTPLAPNDVKRALTEVLLHGV